MNGEELPSPSLQFYANDRLKHNKIWDLLVYKQFEKCIDECSKVLENVMCLSTDERITSEECAWLCQVCIQAYAELNRWSEVLPLVTQLYNGIEDCPGNVFQSCVLLHASVKDYPTCSAICNIWLKNPNNFNKPEYRVIVEVYIAKVLVALDKWSDIEGFVNKCPGLSHEVQEGYKRHIKTLHRRKEQEEIDKIENITNPGSDETELQPSELIHGKSQTNVSSNAASHQKDGAASHSKLTVVLNKLNCLRRQIFSSQTSHFLQTLALLAFILYLLLTRLNIDMLPNEALSSILHTLSGLWRAMFAPFHLARTA